MDISAIALQGLDQAQGQLEQAATKIARAGTSSPEGANVDVVDLSSEIISMMAARNDYAANLNSVKVAQQMQKDAIDLMA